MRGRAIATCLGPSSTVEILMAIEITVPRLGWSMEEGAFCRWLKSEGEMVREGDGLFELEGDKATQVVESFDAGILRIGPDGPKEGEIVKVGQVLGALEPRSAKGAAPKTKEPSSEQNATNSDGAGSSGAPAAQPPAAPSRPKPVAPATVSLSVPQSLTNCGTRSTPSAPKATPTVRRLARELGVNLQTIGPDDSYLVSAAEVLRQAKGEAARFARNEPLADPQRDFPVTPRARRVARDLGVDPATAIGSGRNGRVRERDVRDIASSKSGGQQFSSLTAASTSAIGEPITQLRRVIAQRMMAASHETAPVTLTTQADASALVGFRNECKRTSDDRGVNPPSYTELFVKLCGAALQKHPAVLDQWVDERLVPPDGVHVAVAVATAYGLVTPVIRDVPALSLRELSQHFSQLVELARSKQLKGEQMRGGAFTVSSLGGYRVDAFTPILNPPQTAILGIGRISEQPVVKQQQLAIADVVTLSLTFDHRVVDGAPAAAFLTSLCEVIENPLAWLLG